MEQLMKQMETVKNDVGMRWEMVKIKDITINLDNKRKPLNEAERNKISKKKLYPYIGANNIMGYVDEFLYDEEIICIAEDGGSWGENQKCCVHIHEKCWVNNHAHVLGTNGKTDLKFLMYYLNANDLNKFITGSTRGKLTKSALDSIQIPLPPLPIQKRIAEILDAADALKRKDQELLKKYDELAQAIFIDMFGDPVKNEKGWEEVMLKDLSLKITDGTHLSPKFTSSGIPFLFVSNIVDNQIIYKTETFISEEEFKVLNKRTPIEIGNILLTTVGSYGNPAIIEKIEKFAFQRHIAFIKPDHELVNYVYLFGFLQSPVAKFQIDKKVNGVAQKTLNLSDLKELKIWNVPKKLQDEYANRLMVLKTQIQSIPRTYSDTLFKSLIQKAFKGELVVE